MTPYTTPDKTKSSFTFDKTKLFPQLLGLSALFVAGIAAFFSILGIGMLFSGATFSAILMATSLEVGKLTATTFLYRYWNKTKLFLKIYLTVAIIMLMAITSLGIFGWLSSAYQSSALTYNINQQQISVMVEQKTQTQTQLVMSKQRVDDLMESRRAQEKSLNLSLIDESVIKNPKLLRDLQLQNSQMMRASDVDISNEKIRYTNYLNSVMDIDAKISNAKLDNIKAKDVITFKFVADALGIDLTETVKWFILSIILVFDPLAISLLLAYNVAVAKESSETVVAPLTEDEKKK